MGTHEVPQMASLHQQTRLAWNEVSSCSQFPPVIARRAHKCPHVYGQKLGRGRDKPID